METEWLGMIALPVPKKGNGARAGDERPILSIGVEGKV